MPPRRKMQRIAVEEASFDTSRNRGILFFSCSTASYLPPILDAGVREILASHFYIRKTKGSKRAYEEELLPQLTSDGGVFMADSGAFTYMEGHSTDEFYTEEYWKPILEEYVQWLYDNEKHIYCAANMDLEQYVGNDIVDRWNQDYFKPLESRMNVIYVAHPNNQENDPTGLKRIKQYCCEHSYIGANRWYKKYASTVFSLAKQTKTRVHGFAWTSIPLLKRFPFFSVDSTTFLAGSQFGATFMYDGANFRRQDKVHYRRKKDKLFCDRYDIPMDKLLADDPYWVTYYNVIKWLGARREYLQSANTKLRTDVVENYRVKNM